MKNDHLFFMASIVTAVAFTALGIIVYSAFFISNGDVETPTPPAGIHVVVSPASTMPVRLAIPSLSIKTRVQQTGVTTKGTMGTPTNFTDVAWYKYGPAPGAIGNAVIDGHVDNALSLPGVFKHLNDLQIGDTVTVTNASGNVFTFAVTKKETWDSDASSTQEIFGTANTANLILITCAGTWNSSAKEYSQRIVVWSTLVK